MNHPRIIFWFRQDMRLDNNPGLYKAFQLGKVLPIYILDDINPKDHSLGRASKVWLHHALKSLDKDLKGSLQVFKGNPLTILKALISKHTISHIFWNRCYEPWRMTRDTEIKKTLEFDNLTIQSFNASLLWEPWEILKKDQTPYRVFTPFYRKGCLFASSPKEPCPLPENMDMIFEKKESSIDDLNLTPKNLWGQSIIQNWDISEKGAKKTFKDFLQQGLDQYKEGRNFPAKPFVSRLSPYLHFGHISPHYLWHTIKPLSDDENIDHFLSEMGWREFSNNLLYFNQSLPFENLQPKFNNFFWNDDALLLNAWQKGLTGIPFVDAGMRELWQTGYLHNRVRMVVGSFLVKNLRLHWHHGERWFWDCLFDADLANNSTSWQWVAGCGADASPYFRIFNPVTQGQRFDPEGEYTKKYIPELANLPTKYLFNPWESPNEILKSAGVQLGKDYPFPIVDLKKSRKEALNAFSSLKGTPS